ncbi:MAG: hypothetical protein ACK4EY_02530 [Flavipsychrobacter sp.]
MNINDYLNLSESAMGIVEPFTSPNTFKTYFKTVKHGEIDSIIRHHIVNNIAFAFKEHPVIYEQTIQYIADKLKISPLQIKIIGSAKTGFCMDPKHYGRNFNDDSDIDLSIISDTTFKTLEKEFNLWNHDFRQMHIKATNDRENRFWKDNSERVPKNLTKGYIDSSKIPNRPQYGFTCELNNILYITHRYLVNKHNIKTQKVTASIYRDWHNFFNRLKNNVSYCIK